MDIKFRQSVGQHCSGKVRVAVIVEVLSRQHGVNIWVTSCAKQIVYTTALAIFTVIFQAVSCDGHHWSQERENGP